MTLCIFIHNFPLCSEKRWRYEASICLSFFVIAISWVEKAKFELCKSRVSLRFFRVFSPRPEALMAPGEREETLMCWSPRHAPAASDSRSQSWCPHYFAEVICLVDSTVNRTLQRALFVLESWNCLKLDSKYYLTRHSLLAMLCAVWGHQIY